jgi:hypothetical protein
VDSEETTFKNETHQNIESMWQSFKTEIKFIRQESTNQNDQAKTHSSLDEY